MKNQTQAICKKTFSIKGGATITVQARRAQGRIAVSVHWPAGMDNAPSVRWFNTDAEAIAGYLSACKAVQERYAA